jgi:L-aminopeptidase/D-esterase-like protein
VGQLVTAADPMADNFAAPPGAGPVIVVVGTDAPLLPHQCKVLARRVTLGLARTGTTGSHFSGDLFLAFSPWRGTRLRHCSSAEAGGGRMVHGRAALPGRRTGIIAGSASRQGRHIWPR